MSENSNGCKITKFSEDFSSSVIESKIFATAKNDSGIIGQRLLVLLVMTAQSFFRPIDFKDGKNMTKMSVDDFGDIIIDIPVRLLQSDVKAKNYSEVKKVLHNLTNIPFCYEDEEVWISTHILEKAEITKKSGLVNVRVDKHLWAALVDFTKGYIEYNPEVIFKLRSCYSIFFYKLIFNLEEPITYRLDTLRKQFMLEEKYKLNSDFVRRVIQSAKDELDSLGDVSFTYKLVTEGKKIVGITFSRTKVLKNQSEDRLRKEADSSIVLGMDVYFCLKNQYRFDARGIKANIKLFDIANKKMGSAQFISWLDSIKPSAFRAKTSVRGYVINSLKSYLENKFGICLMEEPRKHLRITKDQH